MKKVTFVSGHLDLTTEEFEKHYLPKLRQCVLDGCAFVVGDAPGADHMAQEWLANESEIRFGLGQAPLEVMLFHMFMRPRNCSSSFFKQVGGFKSDTERDHAMTLASTDDIAWVRPTKSKRSSGTAKNIKRRQDMASLARKGEIASWPQVDVAERELWPVYDITVRKEQTTDSQVMSTLIAMATSGSPVPVILSSEDIPPRLPQELIDRHRVAALAFYETQAEIQRLLFEQDWGN